MTYLSVLEKLQILFKMLLNYKVVLFGVAAVIIFSFLFLIKMISRKKYIFFLGITLLITFIISVIVNYKILSSTFDNFMTIVFSNIYFPSVYIYLLVSIIIWLSFIVSLLNKKVSKIYKMLNSIVFILNNILFIIILNIISQDKIDIFSNNSLYTNVNLVAILELSINLFILWFLSLSVIYITNCLCLRIKERESVGTLSLEQQTYDLELESSNKINDENLISSQSSNKLSRVISKVLDKSIPKHSLSVNKVNSTDKLNTLTPVHTENHQMIDDNYHSFDPQKILEEKYHNLKDKKLQDIINSVENMSVTNTFGNNDIKMPDIIEDSNIFEKRLDYKASTVSERLKNNSISLKEVSEEVLDEMVDDTDNTICNSKKINVIQDDNINYTAEDYKKFIKMLKQLKIHIKSSNISIDDAIAITLISNYSYDDCIKFKKMLESNLLD